jgi:hypothetical protein
MQRNIASTSECYAVRIIRWGGGEGITQQQSSTKIKFQRAHTHQKFVLKTKENKARIREKT